MKYSLLFIFILTLSFKGYTQLNSDNTLYSKGQDDALKYYKGYKTSGTGTAMITWVLTPVGGLFTALKCSSTKPKKENLMYPDSSLILKTPYYDGYVQRAWKIKRKKVWTNFEIVSGIEIAATGLILIFAHPKFPADFKL